MIIRKKKDYIGLTEQEIKDYGNIIEEDAYTAYNEILNALYILTKTENLFILNTEQLSNLATAVNYAIKQSK